MPLIHNGVTIPENVAGALVYNGVNLTQVIYNGVTVWTQSLGVSVGWSGNSVVGGGYTVGIATSGLTWRWNDNGWFGASGSWQTVSSGGVFSGDSYSLNGYYAGFNVSGSSIRNRWAYNGLPSGVIYSGTWVSYSSTTKQFTGNSFVAGLSDENNNMYDQYLETSAGLIRYKYRPAYVGGAISAGAWISLT